MSNPHTREQVYVHINGTVLVIVIMYSRIHEKLLILYFENARGAAPSVLKEKNQQFRVYSTT